jgi:hypothetical protein
MSKKPVAQKPAQKPDFFCSGLSTARHDSSSRARATTSARRAARHDFYRSAQPLMPSRTHLPSAPIKPYPLSLCLTVTAPNPT